MDDAGLDFRLRAALATLAADRVDNQREGRGVGIVSDGFRWLVSDDARTVIGVSRVQPAEPTGT